MSREIEETRQPAKPGRRRALKQLLIGLGASALIQPNGGVLAGQDAPKKEEPAKKNRTKGTKNTKGGGK